MFTFVGESSFYFLVKDWKMFVLYFYPVMICRERYKVLKFFFFEQVEVPQAHKPLVSNEHWELSVHSTIEMELEIFFWTKTKNPEGLSQGKSLLPCK